MIATHNINVNGTWYKAGEEYNVETPPAEKKPVAEEKPVVAEEEATPAPVKAEQKVAEKPKSTTRRKIGGK